VHGTLSRLTREVALQTKSAQEKNSLRRARTAWGLHAGRRLNGSVAFQVPARVDSRLVDTVVI
jgi:hypothetical protein